MEIYGFAGPAGSGKDTAASALYPKGFEKLSFAQPLKNALRVMGFPEPSTQEAKEVIIPWVGLSWRHLAQTLGTEWGRKMIHPDLWAKIAMRSLDPNGKYVVTDVRFENEATAIREVGGLIIHLEGRKADMTSHTAVHASETGIVKHRLDMFIRNDKLSLEELRLAVLLCRDMW